VVAEERQDWVHVDHPAADVEDAEEEEEQRQGDHVLGGAFGDREEGQQVGDGVRGHIAVLALRLNDSMLLGVREPCRQGEGPEAHDRQAEKREGRDDQDAGVIPCPDGHQCEERDVRAEEQQPHDALVQHEVIVGWVREPSDRAALRRAA